MKPYKKDRFKGFRPVAEITYHKEKGFCWHSSGDDSINLLALAGFLFHILVKLQVPETFNDSAYDSAKPSDRKRLNKKNGN